MLKVEVLSIPVRHDGQRYFKGDKITLTEKAYPRLEAFVKVIEKDIPDPDDDPNDLDLDKPLEDMTLPELKAYAKKNEISLDDVAKNKRDEVYQAILQAEKPQGGN